MFRLGLLLPLLLCPVAAWAQFDTATVLGTITDSAGGVVENSRVTLSNLATGTSQNTNTDSNGNYNFLNVRIGEYSVKAEFSGFKTATSNSFKVDVNARQRVDLQLQVGQVTENVLVSDAAAVLETDSSERGQVISRQEIVNLPLNGRAYADLALLTPGVRRSALENQTITSRDASFNVNGQRSALNNFILDGVDNNSYGTSNQGFSNQVIQASPDALAEFKVQTDNYSAEFGRAAGAVVNASIRSGTNRFHGAAWEFLRNTELNAIGFFNTFAPGVTKPVFIQNQFGAAFGGPLIKDKLFIFADYEGLRRVTKSTQFATLPTADQKAGRLGTAVRNPITGAVYADGVVPASAVSPFARAVLDALPLPNLPGLSNNFISVPRGSIVDDKGDWRVDYYASQKLTSFVRYSQREANPFDPPNIPGPAGGNANGFFHQFNQQIAPGITYSINPTSVFEARLGFTWTEGGKSPIGLGQPSLLTTNGITGLPTDPRIAGALNSQAVTGFSQFGRQTSNPQFQNPFVINPKVSYSKYLGRHTLKTGYEYQRIDTAIDDFNPVYGSDIYTGQFSRPTGAATSNTPLLQDAYNLTDFLTGARSHYELNNYAIVDYRQRMHFAYLQDDFKASAKLTLNLGLRYEFATPQWEKNNRLANFDPATQTLIQAKNGSLYDRALVNPKYNNWAPRIGLAYKVAPNTVIRSAYGISYVQFNRLGGENLLAYNGPNILDATIDQTPDLPLCAPDSPPTSCFRTTQQGYPANFAVPANFNPLAAQARYIPKDNPTGYVQSWHFTVQQQITPTLVVDAAYVGNRGTHLMILADYNQAVPNQPGQNLSLQARRPFQKFNTIEVAYGAGSSNYNALQLKVEKRYSAGLYLLNSFTWSKAIDNASGHLETAYGDNSRVNIRDLRNEKGPSGYDQPFNDTTSVVYDLPYGTGRRFGAGAPSAVQAILGGWQFSAIDTATSGFPINLSYSPTPQFQVSGLPTYRPNVIGNPVTPEGQRDQRNYLNRATVLIPTDPSQPFGNSGRNNARSHAFYQLDAAMHKQFRLWSESSSLEFRAEAFNVFNQTNFQPANSNISSSSFGSITATFPARQLQFALKLLF
ncbi:MAG: TonB-dependent receptor [Acidobacteriota bacterium]|nr:TonB-dependent receptor [Acidobacteriota bacterium]